jgi:LacI family transcriptional regulator
MQSEPNVLMLIESSRESGRRLISGIADYARHFGPWHFHWNPQDLNSAVSLPKELRCDGVLARDVTTVRPFIDAGIPVVGFAYHATVADELCYVKTDDDGLAREVAAHLMQRRFRNFAFCGYDGLPWSDDRARGFSMAVSEAGFHADILRIPHAPSIEAERGNITQWLKSLPRPVALMAANDEVGRQIVNLCRDVGLLVAEDCAVIGVDNDPVVCAMSNPPLSSISVDQYRSGYEAAALLDRMMRGDRLGDAERVITSLVGEITVRQSSDIFKVDDDAVVKALRFIHTNAHRPLSVDEIVSASGVSRRSLQRRFREHLSCTIQKYYLEARAKCIAQIIRESSQSLEEIAAQCGFSEPAHLSRFFISVLGETPSAHRRRTSTR